MAGRTSLLVGIRNGITSAQGFEKALRLGCSLYAVDTGARTPIFHPKVYFARNSQEARIVIGSANLTGGGLSGNIEASISMTLDLGDEREAAVAAQLEEKINAMIDEYPEHVFQIHDEKTIQNLLEAGRLTDETLIPAPLPAGSSSRKDLDKVPKMPLKTKSPGRISKPRSPTPPKRGPKSSEKTPQPTARTLIWESKPLTRRDLTIPTGAQTNPTGSMLLKKGALEDIDHRHYFRDEVFDGLEWAFEQNASIAHMERAEARFRLIVRNIDYGVHTLRLSHNTRTDTESYRQRNSMTQIHWGPVKSIIASEDLLGRILRIYRDNTDDNVFVIEID